MSDREGSPEEKDAFSSAMKAEPDIGTQRLNAWMKLVRAARRLDDLERLQVWLQALRTLFNPEHLPLSVAERAAIATRDFSAEAAVARRVIQAAEHHTSLLLSIGAEQAARPESRAPIPIGLPESLQRLSGVLNDLRVLIDAVCVRRSFPYQTYLAVGRLYACSLKSCRHVDLILGRKFKPQFDRVEDAVLGGILHRIGKDELRQKIALVMLHLYQGLRRLRFLSAGLTGDGPIRHYLALFAMLDDEMGQIRSFIRTGVQRRAGPDVNLQASLDWIRDIIEKTALRIRDHELVSVMHETNPPAMAVKMAKAHDLLRNCLQGCVLSLAQAFEPSLGWGDLFPPPSESDLSAHRAQQELYRLRRYIRGLIGGREPAVLGRLMSMLTSFTEIAQEQFADGDWREIERLSGSLLQSRNPRESRELLDGLVRFLDVLAKTGGLERMPAGGV